MLWRKAWKRLEEWKAAPRRKALLLSGARQTGKTTLVREFARARYGHFAELNFLEDPRAAEVFAGPLDADTVVAGITALLREPLEPGDTLVLLDEVQECPRARAAVKFLVEDGRFDWVETGSLLGVRSREVPSFPVGFEERVRVFPMDLEEFCRANGVQDATFALLRRCFERLEPVPPAVHETMMALFRAYVVVGGMPEAVQRYVDTHDVAQTAAVQRDLLELYRQDIGKYAEGADKAKARAIFDAIPSQLDDKNRRFVLADLSKTARQERYASSFLWLADAGVALPCYNIAAPVPPLAAEEKRSYLKLFMGDVGLLCAASLGNVQFAVLSGDLEVNMGSIVENAVAQELAVRGFPLRYHNSRRCGEVDFVVQPGARVLPVEVKSGDSWTSHRALDNVLAVEEWGLDRAVVLCKGNVAVDGKVAYLPLYMAMFLEPERLPESLPFEVDLSALG